ncbi:hypothetical protein DFH08DRAFT_711442 [Mycena albidolilacea]|uniref:Uncharacterized protein n=1 Tax=Mycena albidolilacea TaxID=1033008 RepID=A0AAD6ZIJ0_9AGAR|nr:hypothetical protein DFH08DRAFT_711442 [Mycena albidolilacea]
MYLDPAVVPCGSAATAPLSNGDRARSPHELVLVASNASYIVPEAIRKKFAQSGSFRVPLQYLNDRFCGMGNAAASKALNDLYTIDGSSGTVLSVAKELPNFSFDEWSQAW